MRACLQTPISRTDIKRALEDILVWLTENNTDANCRKVDLFMSIEMDQRRREELTRDIQGIVFDMGGALHDTHTSPKVAENFMSTPQQLLDRVRGLPG